MKIELKEDIYMAKFGIVFPKNVEISTVTYDHKVFMQHPFKEGLLGNLPSKNKYKEI